MATEKIYQEIGIKKERLHYCVPNQFALCAARSRGHGLECLLLRGAKIDLCAIHNYLAMYVRNV